MGPGDAQVTPGSVYRAFRDESGEARSNLLGHPAIQAAQQAGRLDIFTGTERLPTLTQIRATPDEVEAITHVIVLRDAETNKRLGIWCSITGHTFYAVKRPARLIWAYWHSIYNTTNNITTEGNTHVI